MKVVWSAKARIEYLELLEYLSRSNSKKRIKTLSEGIEKVLSNITSKPKMYPLFNERLPNVHKAVITKRTTIFYRVQEAVGEIEVIAVFDTRQDPDKLKIK